MAGGRRGRGAGNKTSASLEFIEVKEYLRWVCGRLVQYQAIAAPVYQERPTCLDNARYKDLILILVKDMHKGACLYSVQHMPQQPKLNKVFLQSIPKKSYSATYFNFQRKPSCGGKKVLLPAEGLPGTLK